MIALLKIYKKIVTNKEDGTTFLATGAQPYAIYENGLMQNIYGANIRDIFPNSGKVFPNNYPLPENDYFGLFELEEAVQYTSEHFSSSKYSIKSVAKDLDLFEVINLDMSYEIQKYVISNILKEGISLKFHPSDYVFFKTSDNYLIGPLQFEKIGENYFCKEDNYIHCYKNELTISSIYDSFNNSTRWFTINQPSEEQLVDYIDVATNERVISEALKQLKDNEEFGDMSRRVIKGLKKWYISDRYQDQELHLKERIQRALNIIESQTLDKEVTKEYLTLLLNLEISKESIQDQVNKRFNAEYNKFFEENKKMINEVRSLKEQDLKITEELERKNLKLQFINEELGEVKNAMDREISKLKGKFSEEYVKQLKQAALPSTVQSYNLQNSDNGKGLFAVRQSIEGLKLDNNEAFKISFQHNLNEFNGINSENLATTILSAIMLNEPILLHGKRSQELAKLITHSISSLQTLVLIPELETTSLNDIQNQYIKFEDTTTIKSLVIHDPHTTSAVYSLPTFFKEQKWKQEGTTPDLTIVTLSTLDEAEGFIDKMPGSPLIAANDYIKSAMSPYKIRNLQASSLLLSALGDCEVKEEKRVLKKRFREWIEDEHGLELEIPIEITSWLNQLTIFSEEDNELYDWIYKVFGTSCIPVKEVEVEI